MKNRGFEKPFSLLKLFGHREDVEKIRDVTPHLVAPRRQGVSHRGDKAGSVDAILQSVHVGAG